MPAWVAETADRVVAVLGHRATWQVWHVRAEAERQVRTVDLPADQASAPWSSTWSSTRSWTCRSVALSAPPRSGIAEPDALRRPDGASVYTSPAPTATPPRGSWPPNSGSSPPPADTTGAPSTRSAVELALLESAANGVALNTGQAALVREMATSGARSSSRSRRPGPARPPRCGRWPRPGPTPAGSVVGLAPSAAAAAVARRSTPAIHTDTLAKLIYAAPREHGDLPDWAAPDRTDAPW